MGISPDFKKATHLTLVLSSPFERGTSLVLSPPLGSLGEGLPWEQRFFFFLTPGSEKSITDKLRRPPTPLKNRGRGT